MIEKLMEEQKAYIAARTAVEKMKPKTLFVGTESYRLPENERRGKPAVFAKFNPAERGGAIAMFLTGAEREWRSVNIPIEAAQAIVDILTIYLSPDAAGSKVPDGYFVQEQEQEVE